MPLRVRLSIAFVAVVLVPLLITAMLVRGAAFKSLDQQYDVPVTAARSSAESVLSQLRERAVTAATALATRAEPDRTGQLADLGELIQVDRRRIPTLVTQFVRDFPGAADFVIVADSSGKVIGNAAAGRPGEFVDATVTYQEIVDEVFVELARTRAAGEDERSVTERYVRSRVRLTGSDDAALGIVIAGFWLDRRMLMQVATTGGVSLTLVRRDRVTATTAPVEAAVRLARRAGTAVRMTPEQAGGDVVLQSPLAPREPDGPTLLVSASRADAIRSKTNTDRGLLAVVVVSLLMAGLFGWLLARLTTRPLAELVDAALAVAGGRLDTRIEVRSRDEIGSLATAFNTMTDELRDYIQALHDSRDELKRNLTRLGDTLSSTHDLNRMLAVVLETAMATIRAEAGSVMLLSDRADELYVKVGRGVAERGGDNGARLAVGEGLAGFVAETGQARHGVVGPGPDQLELAPAEPRASTVVSVPLKSQNRVIGVLNLYDRTGGAAFAEEDVATIRSFANQASVAIDNVLLHQEAQRLAITDGLTGLWNYRYFQMTLDKEIERASRFGRPLALLVMDLDNFKKVNDEFGHQRGDAVLVEMASRIRGTIREVDVLARYGGEEFVLILPETEPEGAEQLAQKICALVRGRRFGSPGDEPIRVTISIGLAMHPTDGRSGSDLLRAADTALYAAKSGGRDTYRVATAPAATSVADRPSPAASGSDGAG
ncbi:MAG TPA: diguanylate cyclase [Mycobacteriales bacterium]|nr:diguanylate cyclase [Mycobacteriales bacterium]